MKTLISDVTAIERVGQPFRGFPNPLRGRSGADGRLCSSRDASKQRWQLCELIRPNLPPEASCRAFGKLIRTGNSFVDRMTEKSRSIGNAPQ
jgi:hypothetical protein